MFNDCIFNILQFSNISVIIKCFVINKNSTSLNTEYFWKLLCVRDNIINNNLTNYHTYKQHYELAKSKFKYGRTYQLVIDKSE